MTYTPDPALVRELAAEIITSHAKDIEYMSVGEIIDGDRRIGELGQDDFETLQTAIHDMAGKAVVAVGFPNFVGFTITWEHDFLFLWCETCCATDESGENEVETFAGNPTGMPEILAAMAKHQADVHGGV